MLVSGRGRPSPIRAISSPPNTGTTSARIFFGLLGGLPVAAKRPGAIQTTLYCRQQAGEPMGMMGNMLPIEQPRSPLKNLLFQTRCAKTTVFGTLERSAGLCWRSRSGRNLEPNQNVLGEHTSVGNVRPPCRHIRGAFSEDLLGDVIKNTCTAGCGPTCTAGCRHTNSQLYRHQLSGRRKPSSPQIRHSSNGSPVLRTSVCRVTEENATNTQTSSLDVTDLPTPAASHASQCIPSRVPGGPHRRSPPLRGARAGHGTLYRLGGRGVEQLRPAGVTGALNSRLQWPRSPQSVKCSSSAARGGGAAREGAPPRLARGGGTLEYWGFVPCVCLPAPGVVAPAPVADVPAGKDVQPFAEKKKQTRRTFTQLAVIYEHR
eukprot:gene12570-biopygen18497